MLAGQVIVGASLSLTVTVKEQVAVLPLVSVAVQVTVVVPWAKVEPLAGLQVGGAPGKVTEAVAAKVTTALELPASLFVTMFAGQVIVGASLSLTVTVNGRVGVV